LGCTAATITDDTSDLSDELSIFSYIVGLLMITILTEVTLPKVATSSIAATDGFALRDTLALLFLTTEPPTSL
jgi:hypothetical protein